MTRTTVETRRDLPQAEWEEALDWLEDQFRSRGVHLTSGDLASLESIRSQPGTCFFVHFGDNSLPLDLAAFFKLRWG